MAERHNQKESSRLFEYPFDFDAYIQERLREIDHLDERKFAKTVLLEGLHRIIQVTEEKYRKLEQRVYEEIESPTGKYAVFSTVINKADFDPTNPTLFPACPKDLKHIIPDLKSFRTQQEEPLPFYVETVFLRADNSQCAAFLAQEKFEGKIKTDKGSYEAQFRISRAKRYQDAVAHLYELFVYNTVPWTTINTAYFDKFFDVYLDTVSGGWPEDAKWDGVQIDFGIFSAALSQGMIPLWNVGQVLFSSKDFVVPCIDSKDYEHELPVEDFGRENGYLVEENQEIIGIRNTGDKVVIRSSAEVFENWVGYKIVPQQTIFSLNYVEPAIGNRKRDSFIKRYIETSGTRLHSKSDLYRRLGELEIGSYVKIAGFEILPADADYPPLQDMNWFIKDELYPMETRRILLIKFQAVEPGMYLSDAMVQFAVSQIQLDEGEYRCLGVLV